MVGQRRFIQLLQHFYGGLFLQQAIGILPRIIENCHHCGHNRWDCAGVAQNEEAKKHAKEMIENCHFFVVIIDGNEEACEGDVVKCRG